MYFGNQGSVNASGNLRSQIPLSVQLKVIGASPAVANVKRKITSQESNGCFQETQQRAAVAGGRRRLVTPRKIVQRIAATNTCSIALRTIKVTGMCGSRRAGLGRQASKHSSRKWGSVLQEHLSGEFSTGNYIRVIPRHGKAARSRGLTAEDELLRRDSAQCMGTAQSN